MLRKICTTLMLAGCLATSAFAESISKENFLNILLKRELQERSVALRIQKSELENLEETLEKMEGWGRVKGHGITAGLGTISALSAMILFSGDIEAGVKIGAGIVSAGFGYMAATNSMKVEEEIKNYQKMVDDHKQVIESSEAVINRLMLLDIKEENRIEVAELLESMIADLQEERVSAVMALDGIKKNRTEIEKDLGRKAKKFGLGATAVVSTGFALYCIKYIPEAGMGGAFAAVGAVAAGGLAIGSGIGLAGVSGEKAKITSRLDEQLELADREIERKEHSIERLNQILENL